MIIKHPIGVRLVRNIIIVSTFFAIFATAIQLYSEYRSEKELINTRLEHIIASSVDSLRLNLWRANDKQINLQLKSLLSFPDVSYSSVKTQEGTSYVFGEDLKEDALGKVYPLVYLHNGREYDLGVLKLQSSLSKVRGKIKEKFYIIAITQSAKTFIVSFLMFYIFSYMVTEHLHQISEYAQIIGQKKADRPLILNKEIKDDELDVLTQTLNKVHRTMRSKFEKFEDENLSLDNINSILEKRLNMRQEDGDSISVSQKSARDIIDMVKLVQDEASKDVDLEAVRRDLDSLHILLERALVEKKTSK